MPCRFSGRWHLVGLWRAAQGRAAPFPVDRVRQALYWTDGPPNGGIRAAPKALPRLRKSPRLTSDFKGNVRAMSSTFDIVAKVISETSDVPVENIKPEAHAIDDLGIDSLDFLDIVFALDKKFGIKIPLEQWTQEVNQGKANVEDYFVLKNLCARIDELVAAKSA
jgi:acyl carrier protein